MKLIFTLWILLLTNTALATPSAFNLEESKKRCLTHYKDSKVLYSNVFSWGMSTEFMQTKFDEVYASEERLSYHANYDKSTDTFYVYTDQISGITPVPITADFIKSVTRQIEIALKKGYAEFVFFPDMGHSHLYFKEKHWEENYTSPSIPAGEKNRLYEKMLNDPEMYALYHLAEQLQMLDEDKKLIDDPHLQFRYWNRNFVGKNDTSDYSKIYIADENKFNTVGSLDGYHSYSAGFAVSASSKGCFPYIDKDGSTKYFDIGLKDPIPDPNGSYGEF